MKKMFGRFVMVAAMLCVCVSAVQAGDAYQQFDNEEIKPYIKIMKGPWVNNTVTGGPGNYRLTAKIPKDSEFVLGLFDIKINRAGKDQKSAVVLLDGVNTLAPSEKVSVAELDTADVSWMRKTPFDGLTYNSRDSLNRDCTVKVVDAKEEYEFGPVKPFKLPMGRTGNLARMDIFIFAGPAVPPNPGEAINYGKPVNRFSIQLVE